jgi:NADH:ubiquinone oxidoreductase subunit F (NADH-binding)
VEKRKIQEERPGRIRKKVKKSPLRGRGHALFAYD